MRTLLHVYLVLAGMGLFYVGLNGQDPISVTIASLALCLTTISFFAGPMLWPEETEPLTEAPTPPQTMIRNNLNDLNFEEMEQPVFKPIEVKKMTTPPIRFVEKAEAQNVVDEMRLIDELVDELPKDQTHVILTRNSFDSDSISLQRMLSMSGDVSEALATIYPGIDLITNVDPDPFLSKTLMNNLVLECAERYDNVIFFFPKVEKYFWKHLPLPANADGIHLESPQTTLST